MSSELERRLRRIEKQVLVRTPCAHPVIAITTPSDNTQLREVEAAIAACPRCSSYRGRGPVYCVIELSATIPPKISLQDALGSTNSPSPSAYH